MATLFDYMKATQRFLRDGKQQAVDPADIIDYINTARREVALRSQCLRILPLTSGAVKSATITSPGSGYTNPVATVSPPDSPSGTLPFPNGDQATATITQIGGQIASIDIAYGGSGYFQPVLTITDPTGSGAAATLATSLNNTLNEGQEVYPFSGVDLSPFPGIGSIYLVRSVSIIYSNYRYSLPMYSFSVYQAMIRQYVASQYQYVPTFCSQFGQGVAGSLYMYPPPSQTYQLEWDCQCLPQDLQSDQDVEAIPAPWTDAVAYWAAYLAYLELQNGNTARMYEDLFNRRMATYGATARPGRQSNPYGRW
jgi:hypothetical protein